MNISREYLVRKRLGRVHIEDHGLQDDPECYNLKVKWREKGCRRISIHAVGSSSGQDIMKGVGSQIMAHLSRLRKSELLVW